MMDKSEKRGNLRHRRSISLRNEIANNSHPSSTLLNSLGPSVAADLDQSLNSLLSAYNSHNDPHHGKGVGEGPQHDSFSTTTSDVECNSVLDASSTSAVLEGGDDETGKNIKKKKASLASRVKQSIVGSGKKDKRDKEKKERKEDCGEDKDETTTTIPPESFSTTTTNTIDTPEDLGKSSMDESVGNNHQHQNQAATHMGIGSIARRVGRRLSLKAKERPLGGSGSDQKPLMTDESNAFDEVDEEQKHERTPARSESGKQSRKQKEKDKEITAGKEEFDKKSKTAKLTALARGLTGRKKSKTVGMERLHDSFISLGTVDRAILETNESMQQALREFGLEAADDGKLMALAAMDDDDDDDLELDDLAIVDNHALQLNLMRSFAQLDFTGMGLADDDETEHGDDPIGAMRNSQLMTDACLVDSEQPLSILSPMAGGPKPQLVVRRNKGNQPKPNDHNGAATPKKIAGRKKKGPSRSRTDGGAGAPSIPFDWEKHAGRRRRSKSLSSLRANAQRQKQNQRPELPKNRPRGVGAGHSDKTRSKALERVDSDGSFDASVLSESVDGKNQNHDRAGKSLPAILHSSNASQPYGDGYASTP
jgi:hypothetical protein